MLDIKECINLYSSGAFDINLLAIYTGKNIKDTQQRHTNYLERMAKFKSSFDWKDLKLPTKESIENWRYLPVIIKGMNRNYWTEKTATQWFTDFMKWLYSSMRLIHQGVNNYTIPMVSISMDAIFHDYLELSFAYMQMCQTLFGMKYIPHTPGPRVIYFDDQLPLLIKSLATGINALREDWGEEYVNRIFEQEIDIVKLKLGRDVTLDECLKLCAEKKMDYRIFGAYKGQLVRASEEKLQQHYTEIKEKIEELEVNSFVLPDKEIIENWEHRPTLLKLMNEYAWTESQAKKNFISYMKWLYTSARVIKSKKFLSIPIMPILIQWVGYQYIMFYFDFSTMSKKLFGIEYFHPINFFRDFDYANLPRETLAERLQEGIQALEEDWGEDFLHDNFAYETETIRIHLAK